MFQNKWVFGGIGLVVGSVTTALVDRYVVYAKDRALYAEWAKAQAARTQPAPQVPVQNVG